MKEIKTRKCQKWRERSRPALWVLSEPMVADTRVNLKVELRGSGWCQLCLEGIYFCFWRAVTVRVVSSIQSLNGFKLGLVRVAWFQVTLTPSKPFGGPDRKSGGIYKGLSSGGPPSSIFVLLAPWDCQKLYLAS